MVFTTKKPALFGAGFELIIRNSGYPLPDHNQFLWWITGFTQLRFYQ